MSKTTYQELWNQSIRVENLSGIASLLDWDQEIYMPEGGAEYRAEQQKTLAGIIHEEKTGAAFSTPLSKLIDLKTGKLLTKALTKKQESAVREWHRDYKIETALPKTFVENFAKLTSEAVTVWRHARINKDFKLFLPYLKKVIEATKQKAEYLGYENHPYDALIDLYDPGLTTAQASSIFKPLKKEVASLLKQITKMTEIDDKPIYAPISKDKQLEFSKKLLKKIGYNFKYGRIDLSTHPFSSGNHPTDSRITTRLNLCNIFSCLSTVLHEAGHSLYAMGLSKKHYGSPLGQSISMGIHESQSRLWETRIGLSLPFVRYILPMLQKDLGCFNDLDPETLYRAINKVEPSFIRVEADEVTYPLHIILRFELEVALIEGSLDVNELPEAWNQKMKEFFGIIPPDNAKGVLQDIHWAMGGFGYFPTYSFGNLYAAELFNQLIKEYADWDIQITKGNFSFIRNFLHANVYQYGRQYRGPELIKKITGSEFSSDAYIKYLKEKYSKIYEI